MCINGSGVSFGQVVILLEFISRYMSTLPVYICIFFQAFIILNVEKCLLSYPFDHDI